MKMKTKYFIFSLLLLIGAGTFTTSCEDMFTTENDLVETDLEPQDTLYQMMGIVRSMQKVAEKAVLLGEVRADLVDINDFTTTELQELANNNVSVNNVYNAPADFYSVINSCNIYLEYVDSLQETAGVKKYKKEIIAAKCFRAWSYLELAKIYGTVPFFTEPLITAQNGEDIIADNGNRKDLVGICDFLIKDLEPYAYLNENNALLPSYSASFNGKSARFFFIPVRLMLAELYLYRGSYTRNQSDFINAVRFYHDYLAFRGEEINANGGRVRWVGTTLQRMNSSYSTNFSFSNDELRVFVPMDTIAYYGNYTDLRTAFNSQYTNNYYAYVNPSARYLEISQSQINNVYVYNNASSIDTFYVAQDKSVFSEFENPERYVGDLRYSDVLNTYDESDMYHAEYSTNRQFIAKYLGGSSRSTTDERMNYIPLYRSSIIYLHFAEALNRAGLPETAFAVLKYGISDTVLEDSTKVSKKEYEILKGIASYGFASNAANWDEEIFITRDRQPGGEDSGGSNSTGGMMQTNQWGIHNYGSGDAWCNKYYYIPTDSTGIQPYPVYSPNPVDDEENPLSGDELAAYMEAYDAAYNEQCAVIEAANEEYLRTDAILSARIAEVDKLILTEEALEGAYEGQRFYDLMRYSMYTKGDYSLLVEAIAKRKGSESVNSVGTLSSSNVFLPLITR